MQRLLIVEDDSGLGLLYKEEFLDAGYDVVLVESGEAAIETLRTRQVDAVVLDIRLGGMNGLETLRELLKLRPETPVVINSAYATFKTDFSSWSADSYVVKSSDLKELKDAVSRSIERRAI